MGTADGMTHYAWQLYNGRFSTELALPGLHDRMLQTPTLNPAVFDRLLPAIADTAWNPDGSHSAAGGAGS